jgi:hypothetical protein
MCPPLSATPITNERGERLPFPYSVQSHGRNALSNFPIRLV